METWFKGILNKMDQSFYHTRKCPICDKLCKIFNHAVISPFIFHRLTGYGYLKIYKNWNLKDFVTGNSYYPCESVFCKSCDFLFSGLRFNQNQMKKIYNNYRGKAYNKDRLLYEKDYKKKISVLSARYSYISEIEKFILKTTNQLPQKILDYGGDSGKNTPFKDRVKSFDIYDISEVKTIKKANKISIIKRKKKYDLAVCAHVIEHTPDLLSFFKKLRKKINSKYFYFEVPYENIMIKIHRNGMSYNKEKKFWHEHVNFFSIKSLKNLIKFSGFKIVKVDSKKISKSNHSSIIRAIFKK